jgi:hypothetical protein
MGSEEEHEEEKRRSEEEMYKSGVVEGLPRYSFLVDQQEGREEEERKTTHSFTSSWCHQEVVQLFVLFHTSFFDV